MKGMLMSDYGETRGAGAVPKIINVDQEIMGGNVFAREFIRPPMLMIFPNRSDLGLLELSRFVFNEKFCLMSV